MILFIICVSEEEEEEEGKGGHSYLTTAMLTGAVVLALYTSAMAVDVLCELEKQRLDTRERTNGPELKSGLFTAWCWSCEGQLFSALEGQNGLSLDLTRFSSTFSAGRFRRVPGAVLELPGSITFTICESDAVIGHYKQQRNMRMYFKHIN